MSRVNEILEKAWGGRRLSIEEGAVLFREADLLDLGACADHLNESRNPLAKTHATYVVDRNLNYTNYCNTHCKFCAFHRRLDDAEEGYIKKPDEVLQKVGELVEIGGTQILMQGGHHPKLGIEYYEDLIGAVHERYPQVNIHSLSAPEIKHIARASRLSVREVLTRLQKAGLESLPGGGAEILVDRVRRIVSPSKISVEEYLNVHRTAHENSMRSTATMVYGMVEMIEERMMHFDVIRKLQDETGGFRAFIPWSFEVNCPELALAPTTGAEYLRMIALSRIMLDNVQHLQAGWVTEGLKVAQVALKFGADDFGGILMEESVISAAGCSSTTVSEEDAARCIREAGKIPCQRNTRYEILKMGDIAPRESVPHEPLSTG